MQTTKQKTGAWCGDRDITLSFPDSWKITTVSGNPPEALTQSELQKKIESPIGSPRLKTLCSGKSTAVIVIDDIMRPTPTADILPFVISEIEEGGIDRKNITIVVAGGSHQKATDEDVIQKVGKKLLKNVRVVVHDDTANVVFLKKTKRGTPIYANDEVLKSEVKVAIGGIYPHPGAGYSGGAKTFVPGICGLETITYLHGVLMPSLYEGQLQNEFRDELVTVAREIGLQFIVNAVLTPDRRVGDLFTGDMVAAHTKGVNKMNDYYEVSPVSDADIVISNAYPFDGSYYFFSRGFWPLSTGKKNAIRIAIVDGSQTKEKYAFKALFQSKVDHLRQFIHSCIFVLSAIVRPSVFLSRVNKLLFLKRPDFYLFYTGAASERELSKEFPQAKLFNDWEKLMSALGKDHDVCTVALYPYAALELTREGIE